MQTQTNPLAKNGIVAVHGYGITIRVHRRHLLIEDGIARNREVRRYHRTAKLQRIVLVGRTGYVTLEAIRWLHDTGAALVHLDADGQLLATTTVRGRNVPSLRRAQALATTSEAGLQAARYLLRAKLAGQASLLDALPNRTKAMPEVHRALTGIDAAETLRGLLDAEARGAAAYWDAWSTVPIPIGARGKRRVDCVPDHWRTFGQRASLLTGGPRTATNPANAMLNYLYALVEAETTLACRQIGLDPGLGIFHTDRRDRDSLSLDIMEATRPAVDAYVLGLLSKRTLSVEDFAETKTGSCRLSLTAAAKLARTSSVWRDQIAAPVERVAHILAEGSSSSEAYVTPLTRANSRRAWNRRAPDRVVRQTGSQGLELPATCRDCGTELSSRRHTYCEGCRRQRWTQDARSGRESAAQILASLRAEKRDPGHGGRAAELRGRKNAAHQRALKAWSGETLDDAVFVIEILPGLRHVPIADITAATGLSPHYCSLIRLGKRVPHGRHWEVLRTLAARRSDAVPPRG